MFGIELTAWTRSVLVTLGYPGIALLVILETVFPPIPSEVILPFAGFLASQGDFQIVIVIVSATTGSVLGSLVLYAAGRKVSLPRMQSWFEDYGRYFLSGRDDLDRAEEWFGRRADWAVLFGRLVPGVRSFISIPAGLSRMPVGRFVLLTALGSGIWNTILAGAGWLLGSQWSRASDYTNVFEYIVIAAILLAGLSFVGRRLLQKHRGERV
ncbi:MAG: DedA family protein [Thermomicrobiales bacterium]